MAAPGKDYGPGHTVAGRSTEAAGHDPVNIYGVCTHQGAAPALQPDEVEVDAAGLAVEKKQKPNKPLWEK